MRTYFNFASFFYGNEFVIQLILISLAVLPWKRRRKYFRFVFPLSYAVVFACSALFRIPVPFYYLVIYVLLFVSIISSFDIGLVESLFYSLNSYCVQHIASTASYATLWLVVKFGGAFKYNTVYPVISVAYLVLTGTLVAFFFTRRINKFTKLKFNHFMMVYSELVFLLIAVFISHYAQENIKINDVLFLYIKLFSFMLGVTILIVNILNVHSTMLKDEKLILQILLKKDREYYERARLNAEKVNIKHHDLKQKALKGQMDREEFGEIENLGEDYFTGNRALDIILTEKLAKCESNDIRLICTADGEILSFMKPYHIYSLFGNALDNAVESLVTVREKDRREIVLSVTRIRNMCRILVSNYFAGELVIENGLPKTNKADSENHGFGIKSIRDITGVYNGEMKISVSDETFYMLIMLPLNNVGETK